MLKKHLTLLALLATLFLAGAAFLSRSRVLKLPPSPVTVSYIREGEFCLTNHTSKTLSVQLWYIEVKSGTNWLEWEAPNHQIVLNPHSEAQTQFRSRTGGP